MQNTAKSWGCMHTYIFSCKLDRKVLWSLAAKYSVVSHPLIKSYLLVMSNHLTVALFFTTSSIVMATENIYCRAASPQGLVPWIVADEARLLGGLGTTTFPVALRLTSLLVVIDDRLILVVQRVNTFSIQIVSFSNGFVSQTWNKDKCFQGRGISQDSWTLGPDLSAGVWGEK